MYYIYCTRTLSAASGARHVKKGEEEALKISNTLVKKNYITIAICNSKILSYEKNGMMPFSVRLQIWILWLHKQPY